MLLAHTHIEKPGCSAAQCVALQFKEAGHPSAWEVPGVWHTASQRIPAGEGQARGNGMEGSPWSGMPAGLLAGRSILTHVSMCSLADWPVNLQMQ